MGREELKKIVDEYMQKVCGLKEHCERCLKTERWHGSVVLMVVDACFTSLGLNYFNAVVPKVFEFDEKFVRSGKIKNLKELAKADIEELKEIWKNERSWNAAKNIAFYLSKLSDNNREALRNWAKNANVEKWKEDEIGKIKGVGLVTFQYLRMMGGVDTIMPDKIVKRVINEILEKAGYNAVENDLEFIKKAEEIASICGYKPIEICWMTWLVQSEGNKIRMEKYASILDKI